MENATVDHDATIIESHKQEALPHHDGGRGYQPWIAYWVEGGLIIADEFREGNLLSALKRLALPAPMETMRPVTLRLRLLNLSGRIVEHARVPRGRPTHECRWRAAVRPLQDSRRGRQAAPRLNLRD